jgi:hypothetical protein
MPRAFVIAQTASSITVLDETKTFHSIPKPFDLSRKTITLNDVQYDLSEIHFSPSKLFTALKEYEYNSNRKKTQYRRKIAEKKESPWDVPEGLFSSLN